jgi:carbon monoxide dehydrogenase subunit G
VRPVKHGDSNEDGEEMTWIPSRAERIVNFSAPLSKVFGLLVDLETTGLLFPGVSRIEKQGEGVYRWVLEERSMAGMKFHGDYVIKGSDNGTDEVFWGPVSGNIRSSGRWKLVEQAGATVGYGIFENEVDTPLPGILRSAVKMFVQSETERGVDSYITSLKKKLEL